MASLRVLFVSPSLRLGGAEQVVTTLLRALDNPALDPHLALLEKTGVLLDRLPRAVAVHDLQSPRAAFSASKLRRLIWRLRPDVVLSTPFRMNMVLCTIRPWLPSKTRVVIREANVIGELLGRGPRRWVLKRMASAGFARADNIVCQSEFMRRDLQQTLNLPPEKMTVIYNPVEFDPVQQLADQENPFSHRGPGPHVVSIGKLKPRKGFDRLIRAFATLVSARPEAQLWILGEGSDGEMLRRLADELQIANHVNLIGFQRNPYVWLKHADLFVLASRFEGTPNVVLEAMACNCPIIVLDHPGGTREVMQRTGQASRVVGDLSTWNDSWFAPPDASVLSLARQMFEVEHVAAQYHNVLELDGFQRKAA